MDTLKSRQSHLPCGCWVGTACALVMATAFGILIGWLSAKCGKNIAMESSNGPPSWMKDLDPLISELFFQETKAKNIENNLRWLSSKDHVAGTRLDLQQAWQFQQLWESQGLDSAGIESYSVLLSYPGNHSNPNRVEVLDGENHVLFDSFETDALQSEEDDPEGVALPYYAYSRPGVAQGDMVYVNYGSKMDYKILMSNFSINVTGKIVLARTGGIGRFKKVELAASYGALALLVFPNPKQMGRGGREDVFPDSWWLPWDGSQRGGMYAFLGDPLTPGYPAKAYSDRRSATEVDNKVLTPIPIQPVSLYTALSLLAELDETTPTGPDSWFDWQEGWTTEGHYQLGGMLRNDRTVRLRVNNRLERRDIHNVFGILHGAIEPDRFIIIGNHRDAWGKGAVDPGGGTAVMLEVARALGKLKKEHGWRPRRTIIFASWAAEEFGIIGSTEWVEEKLKVLSHKAVAYLNLDVVVMGQDVFIPSSSETLHKVLYYAADKVSHPVYDTVLNAWGNQSGGHVIYPLQPNSDFVPFHYLAGIASLNLRFAKESHNLYPAYHTKYDIFEYVKRHIDPTFEFHLTVAQLYGQMTLLLSDSLLLPLNVYGYGDRLEQAFSGLNRILSNEHFTVMVPELKDMLGQLNYCIHNFTYAATTFFKSLDKLDKSNPFAYRRVNDQLMLVERAFIDMRWFQADNNPIFHHVVSSPGTNNCMWLNCCPGIVDIFCDPTHHNVTMTEPHIRRVRHEVATVCNAMYAAIDLIIT